MELGAYLDSADAEEEHQQPRGPAGLEEEEEQQDKRRRDDEHQRGLGLQLHDLGLGILLPAELGIDDGAAATVGRSEGAAADVGRSEGAVAGEEEEGVWPLAWGRRGRPASGARQGGGGGGGGPAR